MEAQFQLQIKSPNDEYLPTLSKMTDLAFTTPHAAVMQELSPKGKVNSTFIPPHKFFMSPVTQHRNLKLGSFGSKRNSNQKT